MSKERISFLILLCLIASAVSSSIGKSTFNIHIHIQLPSAHAQPFVTEVACMYKMAEMKLL